MTISSRSRKPGGPASTILIDDFDDLPASALRPHQVTTGMNGVRIACASVIVPGPQDYPLYYDTTNTRVLAGVATIDTTPATSLEVAEPVTVQATELDTSSSTGE